MLTGMKKIDTNLGVLLDSSQTRPTALQDSDRTAQQTRESLFSRAYTERHKAFLDDFQGLFRENPSYSQREKINLKINALVMHSNQLASNNGEVPLDDFETPEPMFYPDVMSQWGKDPEMRAFVQDFDNIFFKALKYPTINLWHKIKNPDIQALALKDTDWHFEGNVPSEVPSKQGKEKTYPLDSFGSIIPYISNTITSTKQAGITRIRKGNHSLKESGVDPQCQHFIKPKGLHVFKPLRPDWFEGAHKELRDLFAQEDAQPDRIISPDRHGTASTGSSKELLDILFYTAKRDTIIGFSTANEYFELVKFPPLSLYHAVLILEARGYTRLTDYVLEHVRTMAAACHIDVETLRRYGSLIFLRYKPGGGFRRHFDGSDGIGPAPGPILNVTMGIDDGKVFDLMPSLYPITPPKDPQFKSPIRLTTAPGESCMMVGEARSTWCHCIPSGDLTWRYTMAIKMPGTANDVPDGDPIEIPHTKLTYRNIHFNENVILRVDKNDTTQRIQAPVLHRLQSYIPRRRIR